MSFSIGLDLAGFYNAKLVISEEIIKSYDKPWKNEFEFVEHHLQEPSWITKFFLRKPNWENLDRFIPNRAALDLDYAHYMVTGRRKGIENPWAASPTYQMLLTETFNMNRARIFTFKNKPPTPVEAIPRRLLSPPLHKAKSTKPCRRIPKDPERTLDAPGIVDNFYLNLLDWSSSNIIAIALGNSVYLWNPSDRFIVELVTIDDEDGPITGISWALDGKHIAVGLNNSWVQLWDSVRLER
ncbi:hypothetical protein L3X38_038482 [Prunus dulcis]|uniref:Uncharacterized protein n=1 Tax=Prunus dulcis TaxID=3755 RepID=A0AAD4YRN6_PRUDU|nr:hypothetical protein L3X38_038482 [Prunus dulcis]